MRPDTIVTSSRIDKSIFCRFAIFDSMIFRKHFRSPAIFAGIMGVFACICYTQIGKAEQAALLGNVLLAIGLILPAVYFGHFYMDLQTQSKKLKLETPKHVYTISMTTAPDGITIVTPSGEGGTLRLRWEHIYQVYRVKDCIYFYISARQAFLLPEDQSNVETDELWTFLGEMLPAEKVIDRRKH